MATSPVPPVEPAEPIWRMPVERYHAMVRAGVLTDDDRIELLEGVLVEGVSRNPKHRIATRRTCDALREVLPAGWYADEQAPVTTNDSEPEPDISIVRGDTLDYAERHPGPDDVGLVIEVADSSIARDRGVKKRIYARAGIANYWIVDLHAGQLEVYSLPSGPDYLEKQVLGASDSVALDLPGAMERIVLPVARFLPA